jgi:hypothetical protein
MDPNGNETQNATLLPRFTIRALLAMSTICAVAFLIAGMAYRGQYWAWGVTIAIVSLLITAAVHAAWFGVVYYFAKMSSARDDPR